MKCVIEDCSNPSRQRGWCRKHYTRWKRHGDPLICLLTFGKGTLTDRGYHRIQMDKKPILEHRYVMQQIVGRQLKRDEHVHHIDGNRLNNKPENLILTTPQNHRKEHASFRNETHKECTRCHQIKPRHQFYLNPTARGRKHWDQQLTRCNECLAEIQRLVR